MVYGEVVHVDCSSIADLPQHLLCEILESALVVTAVEDLEVDQSHLLTDGSNDSDGLPSSTWQCKHCI